MDRGRWEDPRSARIYLKYGLALLAVLGLSPGPETALGKSARHLAAFARQGIIRRAWRDSACFCSDGSDSSYSSRPFGGKRCT